MEDVFGKRLNELRESKGLTMEMFAADMNHKYGLKLNKVQVPLSLQRKTTPESLVIKPSGVFFCPKIGHFWERSNLRYLQTFCAHRK